jgi:putative DNA primase/helicase
MSIVEFRRQINEADEQTTETEQSEKSHLEHLRQSVLSEDALKDLEIEPQKKYLGPISEGTLGEIFGPRGIGKTFLRDVISLSLTRGLDMGPFKCENAASVLIVDGEMSLHLLQARQALSRNAGDPLKALDIIANERLFQAGSPPLNLSDPAWRDSLIELIKDEGDRWDVIMFDNLSALLPGVKENDSEAWGPVNQFFLQLRWMKKAGIFIHHAGKSGEQRGTSGREDALDWVIKLTLPAGHNPEDGCRFDAELTKSRSLTGPEAAPFTFAIIPHPEGGLTWSITGQREARKDAIVALLGNGIPQREVPAILGIDKGYVSRVKAQAIGQGQLNEEGTEFTAAGRLKYGDVDIEKLTA